MNCSVTLTVVMMLLACVSQFSGCAQGTGTTSAVATGPAPTFDAGVAGPGGAGDRQFVYAPAGSAVQAEGAATVQAAGGAARSASELPELDERSSEAEGPAAPAAGTEQDRKLELAVCQSNQARLEEAIAQYNAAGNGAAIEHIAPDSVGELVRTGCLKEAPRELRQGPESLANYFYPGDGRGVSCKVHGSRVQTSEGGFGNPYYAGLSEEACCARHRETLSAALRFLQQSGGHVDGPEEWWVGALYDAGQLETMPQDPGQGAGSSRSYRPRADGTVECSTHREGGA